MNGLIHYYYGYGKGKTTAALGLMSRALGQGLRVCLVQFLKDMDTGEVRFLQRNNVPVLRNQAVAGSGMFADDMTPEQRAAICAQHDGHLRQAWEMARRGALDLLVLDEVGDALQLGLLEEALLLEGLDGKPEGLEVVMTGHKTDARLVERADYVTEMKKHKHPFDAGVVGRRGVEF